jgi:hypothetical protein
VVVEHHLVVHPDPGGLDEPADVDVIGAPA